jgi:cytochrome c553
MLIFGAWLLCPPAIGGAERPAVTQHDIAPLMMLRCTACHGPRKQEAKLDLRTRESMLRGGKSGPAIVPGKPEESLVLKKIHAGKMPPRLKVVTASVKPMEPREIALLTKWIELGAPTAEPPKSKPYPVSANDQKFWAFNPPVRPAIPKFNNRKSKIANPIDAFILRKLKAKGLSLSPTANKQTLIRRATFDLTGLPPTPGEVRAFLKDGSPDAYAKLIDRLLASPRYGERWGRYWLDLAGYSDSDGGQNSDPIRAHVWRYRDYVIRSFNNDKPCDRFLPEQLAGDELAKPDSVPDAELADNLIATGFLRMGTDYSFANITAFVPDRIEVIDREMEVLTGAVMGLTLRCAKCHDHKFDPIPQADYYRLLAVFKGAYDEHDWMRPRDGSGGSSYNVPWPTRLLPMPGEHAKWRAEIKRIDEAIAKLKADGGEKKNAAAIKKLEAERRPEPMVRALWDRGEPSPQYVLVRGNYQRAGALVKPNTPMALNGNKSNYAPKQPWPGAKKTGRRLAFAKWMVRPEHPLTARVMVNRIWKHHFGKGIVRTLDNFGKAGARPSHPELLDWFATEFPRRRWSLKAMHRLIMNSATYRQSSSINGQHQKLDPENELLSRMPLHKLDAEALRDSILFVAGQLNEKNRGGKPDGIKSHKDGLVSIPRGPDGWRRSIYVQQRRTEMPTFLTTFDLPRMEPNCIERPQSTVAPQALHLLNDATVHEIAGHFAARLVKEAANEKAQLTRAHWLAFSRAPTKEEIKFANEALQQLKAKWKTELGDKATDEAVHKNALTNFCRALLNASEFQYVD